MHMAAVASQRLPCLLVVRQYAAGACRNSRWTPSMLHVSAPGMSAVASRSLPRLHAVRSSEPAEHRSPNSTCSASGRWAPPGSVASSLQQELAAAPFLAPTWEQTPLVEDHCPPALRTNSRGDLSCLRLRGRARQRRSVLGAASDPSRSLLASSRTETRGASCRSWKPLAYRTLAEKACLGPAATGCRAATSAPPLPARGPTHPSLGSP
mmetsp:Transcript_35222/g.101273  ORF Transcript_35222/g.101273 Transcript_35222/m.101273 type:complete len:209 (-) Transcript_35222:507-1133(-)